METQAYVGQPNSLKHRFSEWLGSISERVGNYFYQRRQEKYRKYTEELSDLFNDSMAVISIKIDGYKTQVENLKAGIKDLTVTLDDVIEAQGIIEGEEPACLLVESKKSLYLVEYELKEFENMRDVFKRSRNELVKDAWKYELSKREREEYDEIEAEAASLGPPKNYREQFLGITESAIKKGVLERRRRLEPYKKPPSPEEIENELKAALLRIEERRKKAKQVAVVA